MKIEIELIHDKFRTSHHLKHVADFLASKLEYKEGEGLFGMTLYSPYLPKIGGKSSGCDWGENIGTQDKKIFCHCRQTKSGVYKVKVWGE